MNNSSASSRIETTARHQVDDRAKNVAEIASYAPSLRFFGEVGAVCFIYFQLLYVKASYDFPLAVTLTPLMLYTCLKIGLGISFYNNCENEADKKKQRNILTDWFTLAVYQV